MRLFPGFGDDWLAGFEQTPTTGRLSTPQSLEASTPTASLDRSGLRGSPSASLDPSARLRPLASTLRSSAIARRKTGVLSERPLAPDRGVEVHGEITPPRDEPTGLTCGGSEGGLPKNPTISCQTCENVLSLFCRRLEGERRVVRFRPPTRRSARPIDRGGGRGFRPGWRAQRKISAWTVGLLVTHCTPPNRTKESKKIQARFLGPAWTGFGSDWRNLARVVTASARALACSAHPLGAARRRPSVRTPAQSCDGPSRRMARQGRRKSPGNGAAEAWKD